MSGIAVAAAAAGGVLLWSGVRGKSVTGSLRSLISGQAPPAGQASQIGVPAAGTSPGTGTGTGSYDHAGLVALWQQAGGPAAAASNAACHGMQESSGDAAATSANPDGGQNIGLWQLDTRGAGAGYTVAQLLNPLTNARITVMATRGGADWSQWATPGC